MTRHERFGLLRVLAAGGFVWVLVATHLLFAAFVVIGTGVGALAAWRWFGGMLRRLLEPPPYERRWP